MILIEDTVIHIFISWYRIDQFSGAIMLIPLSLDTDIVLINCLKLLCA